MAASAVAEGMERQHSGEPIVVRLDVQDPAAPNCLSRFGFHAPSGFPFVDAPRRGPVRREIDRG